MNIKHSSFLKWPQIRNLDSHAFIMCKYRYLNCILTFSTTFPTIYFFSYEAFHVHKILLWVQNLSVLVFLTIFYEKLKYTFFNYVIIKCEEIFRWVVKERPSKNRANIDVFTLKVRTGYPSRSLIRTPMYWPQTWIP